MPDITLAAAGIFGVLVGSFTNVLIARIPAGEAWTRGSSRCPKCRHDLAWRDNIPVFSWLWLRRRCRYCAEPISARYPLVELIVGVAFVLIAWQWGLTLPGLAMAYLAVVTTALVFIDIDVRRLPDALVLPSFAVVGALLVSDALVAGEYWPLARGAIGLAAMGGYYGLLWLFWPGGMGFGDVKTAGLLGLAAGYLGWAQLAVAAIAGPLVGGAVVLVPMIMGRLGWRSKVPYGPALIAGAWLGYFAGPALGSAYLDVIL